MQKRQDSGLSVRAFCEQAGFHENNYYYWQRKLREATCEELANVQRCDASLMPPVFAEVKLTPRTVLPKKANGDQSHVCVEALGVRITADSGYPADKLAYLLREVVRS